LRPASLSLPAAAAVLGAALFAVSLVAQAPQPPAPGATHPHPPAPKPTNLKVLPKDLTGDQVMDIMHGWEAQLGVECNTCHTVDPNKKMPNGRPALNFPDDSKKEKETARLMLKMTKEINENYTSMVQSAHENTDAAKKVTCGTCHRGHFDPVAYVPPPKEHEHEHHDGPPEAGEKPETPH
jgi:photosynthetic reaction center cytochrome c subunit